MGSLMSLSIGDRITKIKEIVTENGGEQLADNKNKTVKGVNKEELKNSILSTIQTVTNDMQILREGTKDEGGKQISLSKAVSYAYGFKDEMQNGLNLEFLNSIGFSHNSTMQSFAVTNADLIGNLTTFLLPEIFTDIVRTGIRNSVDHEILTSKITTSSRTEVNTPFVKNSDAMPYNLIAGQSMNDGSMEFSTKRSILTEVGIAIKFDEQVIKECTLDLISMYLEDFGQKWNIGKLNNGIKTLINGDQVDGTDVCAIVGVNTLSVLAYADLLKAMVRMRGISGNPNLIIAGEDIAIKLLQLDEFKNPFYQYANGQNPSNINAPKLDLANALPQQLKLIINDTLPSNQLMFVNTDMAMIKVQNRPFRVEYTRDADKRQDRYNMTEISGFVTKVRDARLTINTGVVIGADGAANGYPLFFSNKAVQQESFKY